MQLQRFLLNQRQEAVSDYLSSMTEPEPATMGLHGHAYADIAIVGAGYTGLSAALTLAERGISVRVLDAHQVGWGGSGRAWGQVAAFAKFMPAKVEQDLGPVIGPRLNDAAAQGPDLVFELIRKHKMQCSESRSGNLIAAHTPTKERELAATVKDLKARGLPVELLDEGQTQRYIGSKRYSVALFDPRGGALNPLGYARGLARAALEAGVQINSKTPVLGLQRSKHEWQLETPGGLVSARRVILATNAFSSNDLFPRLGRAVLPVRAYQAISEPLGTEALETVLPGGQPLNDTRKLFSGVRVWPDGRLQIGVDGPPFAMDGRPFMDSARRRITMMFPQLAELRWESSWGGWVDMTVDEYPRIHRLGDGLWTAFGYSGRGIAIATLMGRDLATLAMDGSPDDVIHPVTELKNIWFHPIHRLLIQGLVSRNRFLDAWNDRRFGRGTR